LFIEEDCVCGGRRKEERKEGNKTLKKKGRKKEGM
jgi:hypothetical protein